MPGDPLTAKALALGPTFSWINHSWDHPILDGLSYADVLTEFSRNDTFIRGLGLAPYSTANVVTPSISGLASADAMRAIHDVGIRQLVSDTSEPGQDNPSPNAGLWNALQPSVLEIPRIPTNLDYDVSQPSEWIPEYEATVTGGAAVDYPTMIDRTSDDLLQDLLERQQRSLDVPPGQHARLRRPRAQPAVRSPDRHASASTRQPRPSRSSARRWMPWRRA